MTETQWAEDAQDKPLRKSMPKWIWFCGAGCLLAILAAIVIGVFLARAVKDAADPVKGWAELQKVLPADDDHPLYSAHRIPMMPMGMFLVMGPHGFQIQVQEHKGRDGVRVREQMFEGDKPVFPENMVVMKFTDLTKSTLEVQGRELKIVRLKAGMAGVARKMMGDQAEKGDQYMIFVDATPEGMDGCVLMQIQRPVPLGEITDDDLRDLLKPFHLGPKR